MSTNDNESTWDLNYSERIDDIIAHLDGTEVVWHLDELRAQDNTWPLVLASASGGYYETTISIQASNLDEAKALVVERNAASDWDEEFAQAVVIASMFRPVTPKTEPLPEGAQVLPMGDSTECPQCGALAVWTRPGSIGCTTCGETKEA